MTHCKKTRTSLFSFPLRGVGGLILFYKPFFFFVNQLNRSHTFPVFILKDISLYKPIFKKLTAIAFSFFL